MANRATNDGVFVLDQSRTSVTMIFVVEGQAVPKRPEPLELYLRASFDVIKQLKANHRRLNRQGPRKRIEDVLCMILGEDFRGEYTLTHHLLDVAVMWGHDYPGHWITAMINEKDLVVLIEGPKLDIEILFTR